jgi:hypothetical protein
VKSLLFALAILGCGNDNPGGVYKSSRRQTDTDSPLRMAQAYFEQKYNHKFNRDFTEFVALFFYEDQSVLNAYCKSDVDVYGCITGFWIFRILDHPDAQIKCQAIAHEAGHLALAKITGDYDVEHKHEFFAKGVFEVCQ